MAGVVVLLVVLLLDYQPAFDRSCAYTHAFMSAR
jgi:hypothetical protein